MNSSKRGKRFPKPSPRPRGLDRTGSFEGVYNNVYFMHAITSQVGNTVILHTASGMTYSGLFRTFSSNFEIVLEMVHKIDPSNQGFFSVADMIEKMIFRPHDVVMLHLADVDMDSVSKGTFVTDSALSKFNGQVIERELEPWDGESHGEDELDLDVNGTANGWDVDDMFRKNEQMYGVTTSFNPDLSGYTTELQDKDSKDYKDAEAKAAKIAQEIESSPGFKGRTEVENGDDEEEKFAAVIRPQHDPSNKYVCPQKRKQQGNISSSSKPIRSNYPPPSNQPNVNIIRLPPAAPFPRAPPHSSLGGRDKMNGVSDMPPKPQRPSSRHPHSYSQNIPPRYQEKAAANHNVPSPQVSSHPGPSQVSAPPARTMVEPPAMPPQPAPEPVLPEPKPLPVEQPPPPKKPAIPTQPERPPELQDTPVLRKITELKRFGSDFKLEREEAPEEKKVVQREVESVPVPPENPQPAPSPPKVSQKTAEMDKLASALSTSKLNPNAKEFVYNPSAKPFTPRSPSTPTQSRPHTPQTPGYGVPPVPLSVAMVMPTYVVTSAQPPYSQAQSQTPRYRKHPGASQRPELSQMHVAAATGQPLLTPAPVHTQFTVPYSPQTHIPPQQYQQMVRMMAHQNGGMVPLVQTAINYPPEGGAPPRIQYMTPVPMSQAHPYHHHAANPAAPSPQASGNGGGSEGAGAQGQAGPPSYQQTPPSPATPAPQYGPGGPPPQAAGPPQTYPLMYPILPAPPPQHNPHLMAQGPVQGYIHHSHPHQQVGAGQQHFQVLLPPHNR